MKDFHPSDLRFSDNLSLPARDRFVFLRLLLTCFLILPALPAAGQFKFREPPNRQLPDSLTQPEGVRIWDQFLANRALGKFELSGQLVHRASGEASRTYSLTLTGNWQPGAESTIIKLLRDDQLVLHKELALKGGDWFLTDRQNENMETTAIRTSELSTPIHPDLPLTWEELTMRFLLWPRIEYIGPQRSLGRPAHQFELSGESAEGVFRRALVTIDEDFAALLKADLFSSGERPARRIRIGGFKQFGEIWMFSHLIWENRVERESIRLDVEQFSTRP